jgi:hypothetical protein
MGYSRNGGKIRKSCGNLKWIAPREDGRPCGKRLADHPRERDLIPPPAQVPPAGKPLIILVLYLLYCDLIAGAELLRELRS